MSKDRAGWISYLAGSIADDFFLDSLPILPEVISRAYGITFSFGEYGHYFDGLLEHYNGEFHIYINTDRHNNLMRHRFSFAHELGHYFIDEHVMALAQGLSPGHPSVSGFISENEVEREADFFAASLLMPENRVVKFYRGFRSFSFGIMEHLCKRFQVSILSALYRIFFLDLHPMMIIKAQDGKIFGYPLRSKDFHNYFRGDILPDDSGPYHYFNNNKEFSKTRELYLFDWFNTESSKTLYEHNIYHKRFNMVYSILWTD